MLRCHLALIAPGSCACMNTAPDPAYSVNPCGVCSCKTLHLLQHKTSCAYTPQSIFVHISCHVLDIGLQSPEMGLNEERCTGLVGVRCGDMCRCGPGREGCRSAGERRRMGVYAGESRRRRSTGERLARPLDMTTFSGGRCTKQAHQATPDLLARYNAAAGTICCSCIRSRPGFIT